MFLNFPWEPPNRASGKKKGILVRFLLRQPREVCPWDKPTFSQGQTPVFSLLYTMDAQFVPGTIAFVPLTGRRAAETVYVLKVYVPFFAR